MFPVNCCWTGIEAVLDVEYIRGVSDKIDLTFTYAQQYSLLDWVTQVHSCSYRFITAFDLLS